ncbi:OmpA family protein [Pararhodobacter zhoushanensis]|nr:OmpA family protein [Pararhodobacter zhoushanensis]
MKRSLSTTTALVTSFALAVPITFPLSAQEVSGSAEASGFVCDDSLSAEQCAAAEADAQAQAQGGQEEGVLESIGDAANGALESASDALGGLLGGAEETADDAVDATGEAVGNAAETTGDAVDSAAEVTQDAAEATGDAVDEAATATGDAVEPAVDATENAAEGAVTTAEDLAQQLENQSETDGAEADVEADVAVQPEAQPETAPASGDDTVVSAEGDEAPATTPAETQEQAQTEAPPAADPAAEAQGDLIVDGPSEAAMEAATGQAEESMATSGDATVADEVTETVTEENARSSDQDFAPAQSNAQADAQANAEDDNDTRFLQGALLGAAGALVVGALLNGNREVVSTAPDRVVVRDQNGNLQVLRDDDAILRQPGAEVVTRNYTDGSAQTVVTQRDGSQIITVRSAEGRVIKRVVVATNGTETVLFDDTVQYDPVDVSALPEPVRNTAPQVDPNNEEALRAALMQQSAVGRRFSLNQVRQIDRVRYLAASVQVENITFATGSAAISPTEAQDLLALGELMTGLIQDNPNEVFLIEGHTDAIGSAVSNLTLSDRRAESVARALTEYFGVSPANMVLQGYGESDLRVTTQEAERANRRVVVRRITPLLQVTQAN